MEFMPATDLDGCCPWRRKVDVQLYIVNLEMNFQCGKSHNTVCEIEVRRMYPQEIKHAQKRFL